MSTQNECQHYKRRCLFVTPCCNKKYSCRLCHNEAEDHELDRSSIDLLVCSQCHFQQKVSAHCTQCGICFGLYSCLECRLFDDSDKMQFHCKDCGFCRIGGRENFVHCNSCEICLDKNFFPKHNCRAECGKDLCPICFESVHSSTRGNVFVPNCGHLIHGVCLSLITKHNFVQCPLCRQHYNHNTIDRNEDVINNNIDDN